MEIHPQPQKQRSREVCDLHFAFHLTKDSRAFRVRINNLNSMTVINSHAFGSPRERVQYSKSRNISSTTILHDIATFHELAREKLEFFVLLRQTNCTFYGSYHSVGQEWSCANLEIEESIGMTVKRVVPVTCSERATSNVHFEEPTSLHLKVVSL